MRDYVELITRLKQSDDNCNAECFECSGECLSSGCNIFCDAADAIVELLAVLGNIASAVFNYGDDPGLSEIIMRKLRKVGIVKMDGDLWVWNTPTKEED